MYDFKVFLKRKKHEKPSVKASILGELTKCDLTDTSSLTVPSHLDQFMCKRPVLSTQAVTLSAELSHTAYIMRWDNWREAGWSDVSVIANDKIEGASVKDENDSTTLNTQKKLQSALQRSNPIFDLQNAFKQSTKVNTLKAIFMRKKQDDGRHLVAIGLMGTGKNLSDWISNFLFTNEMNFHKGFYQLSEYLLSRTDDILFPSLAKECGLSSLSLTDIIKSACSKDSPYRLWISGHSQGAAILQVLCHRLIIERGVDFSNLFCVGFASPSVCMPQLHLDNDKYPIYHILNSGDLVPRFGACCQLGFLMTYHSDDEIRNETYALLNTAEAIELRSELQEFFDEMVNTERSLVYISALAIALTQEKGDIKIDDIRERKWSGITLGKLLNFAENKMENWLAKFIKHCNQGYISLTGHSFSEVEISDLVERVRPIVKKAPTKALFNAFIECGFSGHSLFLQGERKDSPYSYIVRYKLGELYPALWKQKNEQNLEFISANSPYIFYTAKRATKRNRRKLTPPHQHFRKR